jgi:hypothetical protein
MGLITLGQDGQAAARWREAALCGQADPELFFPIRAAAPAVTEIQRAKAICACCPVRRPA